MFDRARAGALRKALRVLIAGLVCAAVGAPAGAGGRLDVREASEAASQLAWQTADLPRVERVSLKRVGKRVQVQVRTTGPASLRHGFAGAGRNRFWVDVQGVYAVPGAAIVPPPPNTVITSIRLAQYKSDPPVCRVVLEVKPGFRAQQAVPAHDPPAVLSYPGSGTVRSVPKAQPAAQPEPTQVARAGNRRIHVVAIDAGHGGRDPGALGPQGLREKNVALDIARRLGETLRRQGHRVHLSRGSDRTLTPAMRTAWLKRTPSDVLVSIHCDASPVRSYRGGASTYYHGANRKGRVLARNVQRRMVTQAGTRDLGIRSDFSRYPRGGFYLLRRAKRPGVLVEVGYISNPQTAKLLATATYRQKLAEGIGAGVMEYLN